MTALVEFEAVARLSSFTLAAHELGVTQAAASRQIKLLEETLGVKLFQRLHRAIKLTPEGEALYATVSESMQKIAAAFDRIASGNQQQELVLAATAAFSQFRVLPRVPALKLLLPSVTLRLITQMFTADLLHKEIDVAVRFGNGKWQDGTAFPLFDEEVFPVCSPAWLAATGGPPTLDALAAMPLIESDSTSEGWMGWSEWFHRLGLRQPHLNFSFRCSLYTDAIQVARSGQGVALGWGRLVSDLLASGELVRLGTAAFKASDAYYIVVPAGRTITPVMEDLINLLRTDFPGLQGFDPD
ncbi:LysR substrate-binding domain-containing protein [Vogesella sp. LIG4]|uniref:LysR substrate-binding domain-containing protein n=1 Tax=Vogesella sp. LIG4 TaxID=1192162 RepID=UPI001E467E20|nr:LysR substrate-binding domain-containing protein [Vogesella sp. LIG4]